MLWLLSPEMWFRLGRIPEIAPALEPGLSKGHIAVWLGGEGRGGEGRGVLPQLILIARMDHPEATSRRLLHSLLERLGEEHPPVLLYPLFVCCFEESKRGTTKKLQRQRQRQRH